MLHDPTLAYIPPKMHHFGPLKWSILDPFPDPVWTGPEQMVLAMVMYLG